MAEGPRSEEAGEPAPDVVADIDPTVPSSARIWNYWVGGKDNFAADRAVGDRLIEVVPSLPLIARSVRLFLAQAVRLLVTDYGIRQFLDIGTGLPTAENTHEVAQRAAPEARIVYVDNDPLVLAHARALLTSTPQGATDYLQADLRDPAVIVAGAARTLDLSQPVAVMLLTVLHFIPDQADPYGIVKTLMGALAPGSFLVIVHAPSDADTATETLSEAASRYNQAGSTTGQAYPRSRAEVVRFFDGLELIGPGVDNASEWLPPEVAAEYQNLPRGHFGIGRKPASALPGWPAGARM